jgi:hypothetical protein
MTGKMFFASLTRIASLAQRDIEVARLTREQWEAGDYVVGIVDEPPPGHRNIELASGRLVELVQGDSAVGAFGIRHATLEATGSFEAIGSDGRMAALTSAGLFGAVTSKSLMLPALLPLTYSGHVCANGKKLRMRDFVPRVDEIDFDVPTVLIVGTSMSAGKTTVAKAIIRCLKERRLKVVGTKLTGAGRYRDVLGMSDAGADAIFDFVDAGLPSSIGPADEFRPRLHELLGRIAATKPDVVVAEAGASPLEPYNGDTVLDEIGERVKCTVLCASDPYSVAGVMQGFARKPDLVAGIATSTIAGVELCEKLAEIPALNLLDPATGPALDRILEKRLSLE